MGGGTKSKAPSLFAEDHNPSGWPPLEVGPDFVSRLVDEGVLLGDALDLRSTTSRSQRGPFSTSTRSASLTSPTPRRSLAENSIRWEGADPGNVVSVPQAYNQYRGVAHTAAMPEGLAEFFIRVASPLGGLVIDPFAGGGTTVVVARRLGRLAGGFEIHEEYVRESKRRITEGVASETPSTLFELA